MDKQLYEAIQQIDPECLPKQYKGLIELIGLEATILLCGVYGGNEPYIYTLDALHAFGRMCGIQRDFDGMNTGSLARKYGISGRMVRKIRNKCRARSAKRSFYSPKSKEDQSSFVFDNERAQPLLIVLAYSTLFF